MQDFNLPDARLVIFEKSGHNALEEETALFLKTICAFLNNEELPVKFKKKYH